MNGKTVLGGGGGTFTGGGGATSEFPGPIREQSAPYTIQASDSLGLLIYNVNTTGGTYTLPAGVAVGFTVSVSQAWSGVLTVSATGSAGANGIRKPGSSSTPQTVNLAGDNTVVKFVLGTGARWHALPFGASLV